MNKDVKKEPKLGSLLGEPGHPCGFDQNFSITALWKGEAQSTLVTFYRYGDLGYERLLCLSFPFVIVPAEAKDLADQAWGAYCAQILKGVGQRIYVEKEEQRPQLGYFEQRILKASRKGCWWNKHSQISYSSVLIILGGLHLMLRGPFLFLFKLLAIAAIFQHLFLIGIIVYRAKTICSFRATIKQIYRLRFPINSFSLLLIAWLLKDFWAFWLVAIMLIVGNWTVIPLTKSAE